MCRSGLCGHLLTSTWPRNATENLNIGVCPSGSMPFVSSLLHLRNSCLPERTDLKHMNDEGCLTDWRLFTFRTGTSSGLLPFSELASYRKSCASQTPAGPRLIDIAAVYALNCVARPLMVLRQGSAADRRQVEQDGRAVCNTIQAGREHCPDAGHEVLWHQPTSNGGQSGLWRVHGSAHSAAPLYVAQDSLGPRWRSVQGQGD